MTRQIDDIRKDIVSASNDFNVVMAAMNGVMIDTDTDMPGSDAVITLMRNRVRKLYKELVAAIKERESLQ